MVPLFKSVGYQLIYHTFSEKCEYIKFKYFLAPAGIAKNRPPPPPPPPRDVQISRQQTCFSAINNNNIILKRKTRNQKQCRATFNNVKIKDVISFKKGLKTLQWLKCKTF